MRLRPLGVHLLRGSYVSVDLKVLVVDVTQISGRFRERPQQIREGSAKALYNKLAAYRMNREHATILQTCGVQVPSPIVRNAAAGFSEVPKSGSGRARGGKFRVSFS